MAEDRFHALTVCPASYIRIPYSSMRAEGSLSLLVVVLTAHEDHWLPGHSDQFFNKVSEEPLTYAYICILLAYSLEPVQ